MSRRSVFHNRTGTRAPPNNLGRRANASQKIIWQGGTYPSVNGFLPGGVDFRLWMAQLNKTRSDSQKLKFSIDKYIMALIEDDIRTSIPEKKMLKRFYKNCGHVPYVHEYQNTTLMRQMVERMNLRRNIGGRKYSKKLNADFKKAQYTQIP